MSISDHNVVTIGEPREKWGPCPFRFYDRWLEDAESINLAREGWRNCKVTGTHGFVLSAKLKFTKEIIKRKDEQMWCQKSRVKWLKKGDRNSKIFHIMANGRMRSNYIEEIFVNGARISAPNLVKEGVRNFYESQFHNVTWRRPSIYGMNLKSLSAVERLCLEKPFSGVEVWEALSSCDGNKVLGPDGLNLNFVKSNWEWIQEDFMRFIHGFHEDSMIVKDLNKTFIDLIPKCSKPESMKDFRSISVVGSMYKILAKVLANRIKFVMNTIIGDYQMAFVKNPQILDSFVIVEEIIHLWKYDNKGSLLVKLDFKIAYDCVDHGFLDAMMREMGFGEKWRRWMQSCISTPMLSVLVNGSPTSEFGIERGLRQGDPLSPFLFNTLIEGLSSLFRKACNLGLISGASFGDNTGFYSSNRIWSTFVMLKES
ncbi:hypothetical protein Ddye_007502 [Dipteronia dyeriana]|uniref:Reverse transcriptase domain-containing protein n=1 Tax=Dipteronia dyeriana TaxID=168575 RepID=A0AAE0CRR1_9ROSI|nr:hypothetical protein Ddye_007502 [Dipteronia dyeriana]